MVSNLILSLLLMHSGKNHVFFMRRGTESPFPNIMTHAPPTKISYSFFSKTSDLNLYIFLYKFSHFF